jgi:xeroderma pigmentosum group C-complementing protein
VAQQCLISCLCLAVDLLRDLIDEPTKFQGGDDALVYVFAFEGKLIADVTKRYCERWSLSLRQIPNYEWVEETLSKYNSKFGRSTDDQLERTVFELKEFSTALEKEPFPTSQEQYRHHPLYVLEKYVGKYDMLWPPDQPALGYFKNQPIYPRKHVYHLHTREKWIQHGMQVKEGEESVKRMRKITYKKNEEDIKESEYFGEWQTETYKPPPIVDVRFQWVRCRTLSYTCPTIQGIIPKNEYGNVYLFKPEMMPIGAVKVSRAWFPTTIRLQLDLPLLQYQESSKYAKSSR